MIDLTEGIPQSAENPLLGVMDAGAEEAKEQVQPFSAAYSTEPAPIYAEEARIRRARAGLAESWDKLDSALLDWEGFSKGKSIDLGYAPNKEDTIKRRLTSSFLRLANGGQQFPNQITKDVFRDRYANEHFEGRGMGDDLAFYGEARKQAEERKVHKDIMNTIGTAAATSETVRIAGGGLDSQSWELFLDEAKKKPGFDPKNSAEYLETWNAVRAGQRELISAFEDSFVNATGAMSIGDLDLARFYDEVNPEQRDKFLASVKLWANTLPVEKQPEFWDNLMKSAGRGMAQASADTLGEDSALGANQRFFDVVGESEAERYRAWATRGKRENDPLKPSAETIKARDEITKEARNRQNFRDDIDRIRDENYDPIKHLNPDGSWGKIGEQIAYAMPSMVQYMGTAMIPGAAPVMFQQNQRMVYRDMRRDFLDRGLGDDEASDMAERISPIVAVPYTALDKLGANLILGKTPALTKVLESFANRFKGGAGRFVARTGATSAFEVGIENSQDALIPLAQEAAAALAQDSRLSVGVWRNGKNGYLDGFWERQAVLFGSMLPFAAMTGLGGRDRDGRVKAFAEASDTELAAHGYGPESISRIREATGKGIFTADRVIEAEIPKREPLSESARVAVEQLTVEAEAQQVAAEQAEQSGVMPRFTRGTDGTWTVFDGETSAEVGKAANLNDAFRLAAAHSSAIDEANADQTAFLYSTLEAGEATANGGTSFEFAPGQKVTATQKAANSPADEARVLEQVAASEALDGNGDFAGVVLGESVTEFKDRVRHTANRINAGGTVLTVFHEEAHGFYREALAQGRLTRDETIAAIRSFESVLGDLRFLPDGEVSETQLDEAVAEFMEAEILRTRKGGGARQLPPGLVTRNLTAAARLAPGAAKKFARFLSTVREFFGVAFQRAAAIKKAIKEGKVKAEDIDAFVSKLIGLDQQDAHNERAAKVALEILSPSMSLGPSEMADILTGPVGPSNDEVTAAADAFYDFIDAHNLDPNQVSETSGSRYFEVKPRGQWDEDERRLIPWQGDTFNVRISGHERQLSGILNHSAPDFDTSVHGNPLEAARKAIEFFDGLEDENGRIADPLPFNENALAQSAEAGDMTEVREPASERDGDTKESGVDASSFSLGPAKMADVLGGAAIKKSTAPKAKAAIFKSISDRMAKLRTLVEKTGNAYNFDAFGKPYEGEARFSQEKKETLNALALLDGILMAMPPDLRGRVGGFVQLAKLDSQEKRLDYLKRRLGTVDRVVNDYLKRQYSDLLDKLFERAKPAKDGAGKKKVGKAGSDVHALFDTLRAARDWDATKTAAHLAAVDAELNDGNNPPTPEREAHLIQEAALVSLIGDWKNADASRREAAVTEAQRVFDAGYATFKLAKLMEKEDRQIRGKILTSDTGKAGTPGERDAKILAENRLKSGWKNIILSLSSFEQVAHYIFGPKSAEAQRIVDMERKAAHQKEDALQAAMDGLDQLFTRLTGGTLAGEQLRFDLSQKTIKVGGRQLSPMEAITATLMWRQEDGRRHMLGKQDDQGNYNGPWHYDQAFVDTLEAALSPEAVAVRDYLADAYAKEWDRLNPIYVKLHGVALPHNPAYSPLTVKPQQAQGGQMVDPVTGSTMSGSSITPGSLRTRGHSIAEPDFRDALQTFIAHTKQMEHWMAYAPFNMEAGAILRNRELGNAVEAKAGEQGLSVMRSWLDFFVQGGARDAAAHLEVNKMLTGMTNRAAGAALIGRIGVLAVQSTQLGAALAEMPTGSYLKRMGALFTGNLGWGAALKSEYIQRRIQQMPPVVQQAMAGLQAKEPNLLKHAVQKLGMLISGTDGLMTAGTYAIVYDYQLAQAKSMGMSGPEADAWAQDAAERSVDRIAQPTRPGARSLYENVATNPMVRVSWAFASESRQKLMLAAWAIAKKPLGEKLRAAAVTWLVGGLGAGLIRAAWRDLRNDDDDEVFDEKNWGAKRLALAAITGPFGGIPVLGDMIEGGAYAAAGEYLPDGNLLSGSGPVGRALRAATRDDWGDGKPEDIIRMVETTLALAAVFNDSIAAASSLSHLVRDFFGVVENATK